MPWCNQIKRLCSNDILNFSKIFNGIKDTLTLQASTNAGAMPRIEYVNKFSGQFDEDLFAEIREK